MKCEFQTVDPITTKHGGLAEYAQWALQHNLSIKDGGFDDSAYNIILEGEEEAIVKWISIFYDTGESPEEIIEYCQID